MVHAGAAAISGCILVLHLCRASASTTPSPQPTWQPSNSSSSGPVSTPLPTAYPPSTPTEEPDPDQDDDDELEEARGWTPVQSRNDRNCDGVRCTERNWPLRPVCGFWMGDTFTFRNLCEMHWFNCMSEREYYPVAMEECPPTPITRPPSSSAPPTHRPTTTPSPAPTTTSTPTTRSTTTTTTTTPSTTTAPSTTVTPTRTSSRPIFTFPTFPISPTYPGLDQNIFTITISDQFPTIPTLPTIHPQFLARVAHGGRRNGSTSFNTSDTSPASPASPARDLPVTLLAEASTEDKSVR